MCLSKIWLSSHDSIKLALKFFTLQINLNSPSVIDWCMNRDKTFKLPACSFHIFTETEILLCRRFSNIIILTTCSTLAARSCDVSLSRTAFQFTTSHPNARLPSVEIDDLWSDKKLHFYITARVVRRVWCSRTAYLCRKQLSLFSR